MLPAMAAASFRDCFALLREPFAGEKNTARVVFCSFASGARFVGSPPPRCTCGVGGWVKMENVENKEKTQARVSRVKPRAWGWLSGLSLSILVPVGGLLAVA